MKKIVLSILLFGSAYNATSQKVLFKDNFNSYTIGNLGADLTGVTPGLGGWYTMTTANGTNTATQIVSVGNADNGLQITGYDNVQVSSSVTRFAIQPLNSPTKGWPSRGTGQDVIRVDYNFNTGATSTSGNGFNVVLFDAQGRKLLGVNYTPKDHVITGTSIAQVSPATNPVTYSLTGNQLGWDNQTSQPIDLVLEDNSTVHVVMMYNVVTGLGHWDVYHGASSPQTHDYMDVTLNDLKNTTPDHIRLYASPGSPNTASASVIFDDIQVRAQSCFEPESSEFAYSSSEVCLTSANLTPVKVVSSVTGTYSVLPNTGLNFVSTSTGELKMSTSSAGTYTVKYLTNAASNAQPLYGGYGCADFHTEEIKINAPTTPSFTSIPTSICLNSTSYALPTSSSNTPAITGTWSPSINNTTTTPYTFTPTAGQCAVNSAPVTISIDQPVAPTFTTIPTSICLGSTSYALPTSSTNTPVITGSWSPAINNTTATSYTFTPTAGQCAVNSSPVTISIDQPIVPSFASVNDFCAGTTAPAFPVSNNTPSIPGTWKLNGGTVNAISNVNTTNAQIISDYTFVPATGQCATTNVKISVKVNPSTTPTFASSSSVLCTGDVAPILPSPTNSPTINGIWSPSTILSTNITNAPVVSTYTFTASGSGCVSNGTYSVTVNPKLTPTFSIVTSLCSGTTAPTLPITSNNSIQGSWIPSTVSNTQQGTYEFTPSGCASKVSVTVTITTTPTAPIFDVVQPICMGATAPTLPTTSINSISGSWSPAQVSNLATKIYSFTPTTACSSPTTLMVTVTPNIIPSFTVASSICSGVTAPILATTSNESVPGTWNPSVVSNTTSGDYIFTPTTGVCASPKTVSVTVSPNIAPTFTLPALICTNATVPVLPSVSTNYITGTWSPSTVNNTVSSTTSYTFTPALGLCATPTASAITVNSCAGIDETSTKVFSIYPNPANDVISISFSELTSINGTIRFISAEGKLIESREYNNSSVETFDVKSLNPGVYFFQIGNTTEKVIIK